jgi:hypothetical protein
VRNAPSKGGTNLPTVVTNQIASFAVLQCHQPLPDLTGATPIGLFEYRTTTPLNSLTATLPDILFGCAIQPQKLLEL